MTFRSALLFLLLPATQEKQDADARFRERLRFLLQEVLLQTDEKLRKDAMAQLSEIGEDAAPLLRHYLEEGRDPAQPRIASLIANLDDHDIDVRDAASVALVELGPRAEAQVKEALQSDSAEVRSRAKMILKEIEKRPEKSPDWEAVTADLLLILARIGNSSHLRLVIRHFDHKNPRVRENAVRAWEGLATKRDLPTLANLLQDADREVRSQAIVSLTVVGREEAAPYLLTLLEREKDEVVRTTILNSLFRWHRFWGPEMPGKVFELATKSEGLERDLMPRLFLARRVEGEIAARFVKHVLGTKREMKLVIVSSLAYRQDELSISLLAHFLSDKDAEVARSALAIVEGMTKTGGFRGASESKVRTWLYGDLCRILTASADVATRRAVASILYARGAEVRVSEIALGLATADPEFASAAAIALETIREDIMRMRRSVPTDPPTPEPILDYGLGPLVRSLFSSAKTDALRALYALVLGQIGDPTGKDLVIAALKSADRGTRLLAVIAAGRLRLQETSGSLVRLSGDEDAAVRAGALEALAEAGDASGLTAALARLDDKDETVRIQALRLIARRGSASDASALAKVGRDPSFMIRHELVATLEALPLTAAPDVLKTLARDANSITRDMAAAAVSRIERRKNVFMRLEDLRSEFAKVRTHARGELSEIRYVRLRYKLESSAGDIVEKPFTADGAIRITEEVLIALLMSKDPLVPPYAEIILSRAAKEAPAALLDKLNLPPVERAPIVEALRRLKFKNAVPALRKMIEKESDANRIAYYRRVVEEIEGSDLENVPPEDVYELSKLIPVLPREQLAQRAAVLLGHKNHRIREEAKCVIVNEKLKEAVPHLFQAHSEGRIADRKRLAEVLQRLGAAEGQAFLILSDLLKDPDPSIRLIAARTLLKARGADALEWVLPLMKEEGNYYWMLLEDLAPLVRRKDAPLLEAAAADVTFKEKAGIYCLLVLAGKEEYRKKLAEALPETPGYAATVVRAFEGCRDAACVKRVIERATACKGQNAYPEFLRVLATTGSAEAQPLLIEYLSSCARPDDLFDLCLDALLEAPSESHVDLMKTLIARAHTGKRHQVARLLGKVGTESAARVLVTYFDSRGCPAGFGYEVSQALVVCKKDAAVIDRILAQLVFPDDQRANEPALLAAISVCSALPFEKTREPLLKLLRTRFYAGKRFGDVRIPNAVRLLALEVLAESEEGRKLIETAAAEFRASTDSETQGVAYYADWVLGKPLRAHEIRSLTAYFQFLAFEARLPQFVSPLLRGYRSVIHGSYEDHYLRIGDAIQLLTCRDFVPPGRRTYPNFEAECEKYIIDVEDWIKVNRGRPFEEVLADGFAAIGYDLGPTLDRADVQVLVRALRDRRLFVGRNAAWALASVTGEPAERFRRARMHGWWTGTPGGDSLALTEAEVRFWEDWAKKNEKRK